MLARDKEVINVLSFLFATFNSTDLNTEEIQMVVTEIMSLVCIVWYV
jgi:hypothetical protein